MHVGCTCSLRVVGVYHLLGTGISKRGRLPVLAWEAIWVVLKHSIAWACADPVHVVFGDQGQLCAPPGGQAMTCQGMTCLQLVQTWATEAASLSSARIQTRKQWYDSLSVEECPPTDPM